MKMKKYEEKISRILELLHRDCRVSLEQMATMVEMPTEDVAKVIEQLEKEGIVLGYGARINWDKANKDNRVTAYIELKVTPQRDRGFERVAERIYQYPEVTAVNLMSGGYDFGITVEGESIQEVARFVSQHLATMESVVSTATHFVLKRYKYDSVVCAAPQKDEREIMSL